MTALVPQATGRNMKALHRALEAHKKDRDLHENLMAEALENSVCASRTAEFFMDLSLIVAGTQPKNAGWKQLPPTARGTTAYIATHICKE